MRPPGVRRDEVLVQAPRLHARRFRDKLAPLVAMISLVGVAVGQDQAREKPSALPAKLVALTSPIDEAVAGRVQNVALQLQAAAGKAGRDAVLVLEIPSGSSKFGAVRDLAQFLTSAEVSRVRTVAWVPETVDGNNVVVALACNEIVLHPDAALGDIGRGQAVDPADADFVLRLAERRHNPKVSTAIVRGMLDPQVAVLRATIGEGPNAAVRVVTAEELKQLQQETMERVVTEPVKEAGVPGRFSGSQARRLDVLVAGTAQTRQDIAELYDLPSAALRPDPTAGQEVKVAFIKIDGMIEPVLEEFVIRQIDREVAGGADLLIFEIDSPGGLLLSSQELAFHIASLDPKQVRTVAYVPEQALSGAAIIALGCDEIYLRPNATIGDAEPIEVGQGQAFERAPEKVLSVLRKILRDLAEMKGRPPAVCEAMADQDLAVFEATHRETGRTWYMTEAALHEAAGEWIKGPRVPESRPGNLLTVGGARAHELKIAEPPVADLGELQQRLGVPGVELTPVGRTWVDSLIFFLNQPIVAGALIALGIVLIYLELHFLTGLLGIMSALCFTLFFWSKFLGGTAGWLEVVLFLLGLACIAIEVFVVPGFGVFGVSGGLLLIAALVLAMQTFGNQLDPGADLSHLTQTIGILIGAIVVTVGSAIVMSRLLPRMPILGAMILAPPGADELAGPRLRPHDETTGTGALVGKRGRTASPLRPAGKAEIDGDYLDVVSDGGFIDAGTPIEVVRREGNRVIVREV